MRAKNNLVNSTINIAKNLNSRASQKQILMVKLQNVKLKGNLFHLCSDYIISAWSNIDSKA